MNRLPSEKQELWAEYKRRNNLGAFKPQSSSDAVLGASAAFDDGMTFGFGRKLGGAINAAVAAPLDALLTDKSLAQAAKDRYNEIVSSADVAKEKFAEENPNMALGLELSGGIVNPLNKIGAGYIAKGAGTASKIGRSAKVGAGTGGLYALGQAKDVEDLQDRALEDTLIGGSLGAALPVVGNAVKSGAKVFFPKLATSGKQGGLINTLNDNDSVKMLKRGIQASDDVASQIKAEATGVLSDLNQEAIDALEGLTGRKLNIKQANENQTQRLIDFIADNADREVFNAAPTREMLAQYPAQSRFNLPKTKPTKEQAQEILRNRAKQSGVEFGGDIDHYTKDSKRTDYVRTLANTLENPDIIFTRGNKGYVAKKYDANGKPFFDFIAQKKGNIHTKFPTDANYLSNQLKKNVQNVSLNASLIEPTGAGHIRPAQINNNSITPQRVVVNADLPPLSDYMRGLDQHQTETLAKVLSQGAKRSTHAKGTLAATHRGQELLNDMIRDSYYVDEATKAKIATTETRELMKVKERLNSILENGGIKPFDAGLSKAKSLEHFFSEGFRFNPNEVKFENLGLKTARDKRAFLQGRIAAILKDVKDDKSVADAVKKDINTLKKLMPEGKFKELMKTVDEIDTRFKRMRDLQSRSVQQLVKPEAAERPLSEKWESATAAVGGVLDNAKAAAYSRANEQNALRLLNGSGRLYGYNPLLENILMTATDGSLTPYLVQALSR